MENKILTAVFLSVFLLSSHNVKAVNFTDNQTVDSNKTWIINFNDEISFNDLTKQGIIVTDKDGNKVNAGVELRKNNKTIEVTAPQGGYRAGEKYTLNVQNKVHSSEGKQLNNELKLHFNIKNEGKAEENDFLQTKIKSGNLCYDYQIEKVLSDIDKFQFNTINIPVVVNIDNVSSSDVTIDKSSEDKAIKLLNQLKGKNIKIVLEAYPLVNKGESSETEWMPNDMDMFFSNWRTKVLKILIDDIAEPYNVDVLNIGSNFEKIESQEKNWCDTIDYVRTYYKGLVTYRTNKWDTAKWDPKSIEKYESKLNNKLFSKLDFISIAAYFELTDNPKNTVENLTSAIENSQRTVDGQIRNQNIKQEIKKFHDKWNKPIFLGELGFTRTDGAAVYPWSPNYDKAINNMEQANCFEAYRREFENEAWLLGFSVFAVGEQSADKNYYPSEESTEIIRNWYSKQQ